jgi:hypothetical protein
MLTRFLIGMKVKHITRDHSANATRVLDIESGWLGITYFCINATKRFHKNKLKEFDEKKECVYLLAVEAAAD